MNEITLYQPEQSAFRKARNFCAAWSKDHQLEIGLAEMALGAAAIAWGVKTGVIQMGVDVVAGKLAGGAAGAGLGILGGKLIGGIGVAGMGGAIAVPAVVLGLGGAAVLGAAGAQLGDAAQKALLSPDWSEIFSSASALAVGIALMIDGARRVIKDARVLKAISFIKNGVIHLMAYTAKVVAKTVKGLNTFLAKEPIGALMSGATAAGGAVMGGSVAAGMVTVAGSHTLGALALSVGLVSAPLWPVLLLGGLGGAVGLGAWKMLKG